MSASAGDPVPHGHSHVFLGSGHDRNARRTWAVIWLCGVMMIAEIVGGSIFGSLALIADGLHMSTHAGALLLAALAYSYARKHAEDRRFVFGTGKLGDLGGFSSAVVLAMIALLIGYEAVVRLLHPIAISFNQAIPIAVVGLIVNIASAWILSGGRFSESHEEHRGHGHHHGHAHEDHDDHGRDQHGYEQHGHGHHAQGKAQRDNNMRAAFVHVVADAFVSILAITGLAAGKFFGWVFMDPVMGIVGAFVIANWSYGLIRDTGAVLMDMSPDRRMAEKLREVIEADGDTLSDLHLWRLGPGHLGAIVSVITGEARGPDFYRARLRAFHGLSHVTIEVRAR
jgi:cation diffusion facilitator family transporter